MKPFRYLPLVVLAAAGLLMHAPTARAECVHGLQGHSLVWGAPGSRASPSVEDLLATVAPQASAQDETGPSPAGPADGPCLTCHQHPVPVAPRQGADSSASDDLWLGTLTLAAAGFPGAVPGAEALLYGNPILDRPEPPPRAAC
jgi:hypothetical protein